MSRRVLLTGSTGFVGKQILKALQKEKIEITLVVRSGWQEKIHGTKGIAATVETDDIFAETSEWWSRVCENIDIIIHAAWYTEPGEYLVSDKNMECLQGSLELAKGAANAGVKKIIGVGTCFEYDLTGGVLSIDTPLKPITPYAATKVATYTALSQWLPQKGIEFAWCRLFYLFGAGEDGRRLVPYIRSQLENDQIVELTSGNQIRDFLDVAEAGRMISDIALGSVQGAVNVCSGLPVTVRQLAERIADEYGKRELLQFDARPDNLVDPPCVVGVK